MMPLGNLPTCLMCFVIIPAKKYNDMSAKSVLRRNMGDLFTANLFQKYAWGKQTKRGHITGNRGYSLNFYLCEYCNTILVSTKVIADS
jgi:hypothetical protein